MSKLMTAARRVIGGEPDASAAPAEPKPRNLKAEYTVAAAQLIKASRRGDQWEKVAYVQALQEIRRAAAKDGHADKMEALWIEPQTRADAKWLDWYERAIDHKLRGGPDPDERPFQTNEWGYWAERYRECCAALAEAYQSGDRGSIDEAEGAFWNLPKQAANFGGLYEQVGRHFMNVPARRGDNWIERWHAEALFRLEHGRPSGTYSEPPLPPFVRRYVDILAEDYSYIVLLAEHDGHPVGARVRLDAGTSHQLVEAGNAVWCDPAAVPDDPRPPAETVPDENWIPLHFLKQVRLRSRHQVGPGVVRPVPPDEARSLIANLVAEMYVPPPPPPPPPPRAIFE